MRTKSVEPVPVLAGLILDGAVVVIAALLVSFVALTVWWEVFFDVVLTREYVAVLLVGVSSRFVAAVLAYLPGRKTR